EEKGGVAVITLLRAVENLDGMAQLSAEISECCQGFGTNGETRVLVVTGERAGAFSMEKAMRDMGKGRAEFISIAEPIAALERPVLAGIPGDARGSGLELALACDVRIAAEGARFALPHVRAGVMPWDGGTQRLLRTVGKGKTLEMILTGESIDAQEANRIGLVSRCVPAAEVITTVMKMAQEMAAKSPISLDYCKEAINKGMDLTLQQGLRLEADLYYLMHTTRDREEGIKAFKEKRRPEFRGI
ncbi:MAG: enoyl-CoA hydratase-related protein, partial [Desulfobacterales bacterium]|nr:enoyl-CoA hydratase-related protein [Desulfobacterales bacterium]